MKKITNILTILALFASFNQAWAIDTDGEGYYLIGSVQDWKDFAALIETNATANARMTSDIDLGTDQTMIGDGYYNTAGYRIPFSGIFDGQGYTLTVHYVTATLVDKYTDAGRSVPTYLGCAPFGYVDGGTIRNLHTAGTITATHEGVAGIVGYTNGTSTIENCRSSVDITYTDSHRGMGGISYFCYGGTLTINDCLYDGTLTGGTATTGAAGFVCYRSSGSININNSLMYGTLVNIGTSDCCTFVRNYSNCTFTNCYYKTALGTTQGTAATLKELCNGTTVTALQASRGETVWVKDPVLGYPVPQLFASAGPAPSTDLMYIAAAGEVTILGFADAFIPPADYALVIPNEIAGMTVVAIGENAFKESTTVVSVSIPATITSIGASVFESCSELVTATFADGIILTDIPSRCFYYCSKLGSIAIPSSVTTVGTSAFYHCDGITSLTIPSTVRTIADYGFDNCRGLTSLTIEPGVTSLGGWSFRSCKLLTEFIIPSTVTTIGTYAFSYCSALEEVTIPSSVTSIGNYIFNECSALRELNINCRNIPSSLCESKKNLTTVVIGSNVRTIGEYAFSYCEALNSITFEPGGMLTTIGASAFRYCYELAEITIPNTVTSMGGGIFRGDTKLVSVTFAGGGKITSLGDNTFYGCSLLDGVIIPGTVTALGSSVFYDCTSLSSITIPASVTSMGTSVFCNCSNLASATFGPGINMTTIPGSFFKGCAKLAGITIPTMVTTIDDEAFRGCTSLPPVTIPSGVTTIGKLAFFNCKFNSLTIPSSVTSLGKEAFAWCTNITSIDVPASVTSMGTYVFNHCSSLRDLTFSASTMGAYAFQECARLENVTIASSVRTIDNYVFKDCTNLRTLVIPRSVTSLGRWIVQGCTKLETLDLRACSDLWDLYKGGWDVDYYYASGTDFEDLGLTMLLPPGSNAIGTGMQVQSLGTPAQDAYGWYLINSAEDFNKFAAIVRGDPTVNAYLEKDIILTGNELTLGVGPDSSNNVAFSGTFDGQGHSITVNFTGANRIQHPYGGLFTWTNGATIQNVWMKGTMETTQPSAGGFVGGVTGTLTISKCKSSVSITGIVSALTEMYLGGFLGQLYSATVSVNDCLTTITASGGTKVKYVAGITGRVANSSTFEIHNCLSMTSLSDITSPAAFAWKWNDGSTAIGTHNIYWSDGSDGDLAAAATAYQTAVSPGQLADGSVATFLQMERGETIWVQDPITNQPALKLFANAAILALAPATAATVWGESKYVTTFYSPVFNYRLPEGAQAYTVELDGTDVVFYRVGDHGNIIPSNTAVIIVSNSQNIVLTEMESTTVWAKPENILTGSDTDVTVTDGKVEGRTPFVLGINGGTLGLYKFSGTSIPAGKAFYLKED